MVSIPLESIAQSEHVTCNLVQFLKAMSQLSRQTATKEYTKECWRNDHLAVFAAKQQPAASSLFGALPLIYATIC
jgi:hypothetical protein